MKKAGTLFIIFFVVIAGKLSGQNFMGGITAGLATSQVDGDTYSGYNRAGFILGGFVNHKLSGKTDLQLEIKYMQRGSFKNPNLDIGDYTKYSLKLDYVEVPLLLQFNYKPRIVFETGFTFAYLASVYEGNENGAYPIAQQRPFHKFDSDFILGGSYKISRQLSFNIKYDYSVVPIRRDINGEVRYLFLRGQFNNTLCFSFYYQFGKSTE